MCQMSAGEMMIKSLEIGIAHIKKLKRNESSTV